MAHWRSMVGQRISFDVADLGGKELLVQIESAKPGEVEGFLNGKKAKTRVVQLKLVGYERPLGAKPTLCKSVVDLYGSGEIESWVGKWLWLYTEMVNDPSRGGNARTEAVRIRPRVPTEREIETAVAARGGKAKAPPPATPPRDDAADQRLVGAVCSAVEAATTEEAIEAAIAPHREEIKQMDKRLQSIVLSAKKVALDAIKNPATPPLEGTPDVA